MTLFLLQNKCLMGILFFRTRMIFFEDVVMLILVDDLLYLFPECIIKFIVTVNIEPCLLVTVYNEPINKLSFKI